MENNVSIKLNTFMDIVTLFHKFHRHKCLVYRADRVYCKWFVCGTDEVL